MEKRKRKAKYRLTNNQKVILMALREPDPARWIPVQEFCGHKHGLHVGVNAGNRCSEVHRLFPGLLDRIPDFTDPRKFMYRLNRANIQALLDNSPAWFASVLRSDLESLGIPFLKTIVETVFHPELRSVSLVKRQVVVGQPNAQETQNLPHRSVESLEDGERDERGLGSSL